MHPSQKEHGIEMTLFSPAGLICHNGGKNYYNATVLIAFTKENRPCFHCSFDLCCFRSAASSTPSESCRMLVSPCVAMVSCNAMRVRGQTCIQLMHFQGKFI